MDLSLQRGREARRKREREVSILVLMDLSLQQNITVFKVMIFFSFNPCFNGSFTSTKLSPARTSRRPRVSILVLMDLSLQLVRNTVFPLPCSPVSILVLMDLSLQLNFILLFYPQVIQFQSLF